MSGKYDNIINLPHHNSDYHPRMSMVNRAAQFAPFAALTGYGDAIDETARTTVKKIKPEKEEIEKLNRKLSLLNKNASEHPEIEVTFFVSDKYKDGGRYETLSGSFKKIEENFLFLVSDDITAIPLEDISDISAKGLIDESELP